MLIPLTRPAEFREAGLPFRGEHAARWAHRRRHENGLAGAFVQVGRRIYIDTDKFYELARCLAT